MTPLEIRAIRKSLGLTQTELSCWLMLSGAPGGHTVRMWESGKRPITGPVEVCLRAFSVGYKPPHID